DQLDDLAEKAGMDPDTLVNGEAVGMRLRELAEELGSDPMKVSAARQAKKLAEGYEKAKTFSFRQAQKLRQSARKFYDQSQDNFTAEVHRRAERFLSDEIEASAKPLFERFADEDAFEGFLASKKQYSMLKDVADLAASRE